MSSVYDQREPVDSAANQPLATGVAGDSSISDLGSVSAWYAFEAGFNVQHEEPYYVRVRAEHEAGGIPEKRRASDWVYIETPAYASCAFDQFMPMGLPVSEKCLPCPEGAVCGGMHSTSIAPQEGFQRLDWSFGRIGFKKCEVEGVCRGIPTAAVEEARRSTAP